MEDLGAPVMWRERVEPRGHAMLEWNRAESVIAAQRQRSTKRLELAFPREWGMGLKVRPKIVARFTISGCIVRILGVEEERRVRITRSRGWVLL